MTANDTSVSLDFQRITDDTIKDKIYFLDQKIDLYTRERDHWKAVLSGSYTKPCLCIWPAGPIRCFHCGGVVIDGEE